MRLHDCAWKYEFALKVDALLSWSTQNLSDANSAGHECPAC